MKTILSVIIMLVSAFLGLFAGASLDSPVGGIIAGILLSGIACIIYAIDNSKNE